MAQSLRQIKTRIKSIESTRKLTRAMEMVSIAKLRRAQFIFEKIGLYSARIEELLKNISSGDGNISSVFLKPRRNVKNIALCVITSDNGLCGSYNHNVIRKAENFLKSYQKYSVKLIIIGKKGFIYFKKNGFNVTRSYLGLNGRYSPEISQKLLDELCAMFSSGEAGEVYVAYTRMETAARHNPVIEKFLNIDSAQKANLPAEYIFEPDFKSILENLVPIYLLNKIKSIILSAFVCEHQGRAMAMGEATQNAKELLSGLILKRNKLRQSNITTEMLEVISSAEALK